MSNSTKYIFIETWLKHVPSVEMFMAKLNGIVEGVPVHGSGLELDYL